MQTSLFFPSIVTLPLSGWLVGLAVAGSLTVAAKATKSVDWGGALSGGMIAFTLFAAFGWCGVAQLMAFFALGTASSKIGFQMKQKKGTAQEIRTWRNAFANAGVGFGCAGAALLLPQYTFWLAGMAASFAAAASDTVAGEIGRVYGRNPRMITTLQPARSGENGAISMVGTLTGLLVAFVMAGITQMFHSGAGWKLLLVIGFTGFLGNLVDSLLGATLENRGLLNNEQVNFLCTLTAACLAVALH
ncbi:MAG: DUF92 domain-containing protein [Blastocatellia bacterium]|nr:DUF92 domain-containing protein [Blastocatellia bacterium]